MPSAVGFCGRRGGGEEGRRGGVEGEGGEGIEQKGEINLRGWNWLALR